jgi:hypothetical protein
MTPSTPKISLRCEQLEDRLALDATSYVSSLYVNLLHRQPDSAGLAFYVGEINSGTSNLAVAQQIWGSPEHRGVQVDSYYKTFLHRAADASGRAYWVNQLVSGILNEQGVEIGFLYSPEFVAGHSTPAAYVSGLYLTILNRAPTTTEQSFWQSALQLYGAPAVAAGILTSGESYTDIINNYYQQYLNRRADPAGLDHWLSGLQSNQQTVESVGEGILGSAEYAVKH